MTLKSRISGQWARHRKVIAAIGLGFVTLVAVPIMVAVVSDKANKITESGDEGPPIKARLLAVDRDSTLQGADWVFAAKRLFGPAELGRFASAEDAWMRGQGAVDPLLIRTTLLLEGARKDGVTVTDMRLEPKCSASLTGTLLHKPPGAGPVKNPRVGFDLDGTDLRAWALRPGGKRGGEYFQENAINLKKNESVVITAEVRSRRKYCTFDIIVSASNGTVTTKVKVNTGNVRLAVTGYADSASSSSLTNKFGRYQSLFVHDGTALIQRDPRSFRKGA